MVKGLNLIRAEEEVISEKSHGKERVVNPGFETIRPKFSYIETQALTAGAGRLGAQLRYAETTYRLAESEMSEFVSNEINGAARKSKENISMFERQERLSAGLTQSEALSSYQQNLFLSQQEYVGENPSGEGLYDFTLDRINDISLRITNGISSTNTREETLARLSSFAGRDLSRAMAIEIDMKTAHLAYRFESETNNILSEINGGLDVGQAIEKLKPTLDAMPENMKKKYEYKTLNGLAYAGMSYLCDTNLELANANLEESTKNPNSAFKILNNGQRVFFNNYIKSKIKDLDRLAIKSRAQKFNEAVRIPTASRAKLMERVIGGRIGSADLEKMFFEKKISKEEYESFQKALELKSNEDLKDISEMAAHREIGRRTGNYGGVSRVIQNRIFGEDLISAKVYDDADQQVFGENIVLGKNGEPEIRENGEMKVERRSMTLGDAPLPYICDYARRFTESLPELQDRIMSEVMGAQDPGKVMDAISAYQKLKFSNAAPLGPVNSKFNRLMNTAVSLAQTGSGPAVIRAAIEEANAPKNEAFELEMKERLEGEDQFNPEFIKGDKFDRENGFELKLAEMLYKRDFRLMKGNADLAYQNVSNYIETLKKSSSINGKGVESVGFGYPESFGGEKVRGKFCTYATRKIDEAFSSSEGKEINGIKDYEFPKKLSMDFNDFKINGKEAYYFFVPTGMDSKEYYIKYNFKNWWSSKGWSRKADYNSGYFIIDPSTNQNITIKMKDALEYKYNKEFQKFSNVMERIINPTNLKAQDLDLALGSCYPAEIERLIKFYSESETFLEKEEEIARAV